MDIEYQKNLDGVKLEDKYTHLSILGEGTYG